MKLKHPKPLKVNTKSFDQSKLGAANANSMGKSMGTKPKSKKK